MLDTLRDEDYKDTDSDEWSSEHSEEEESDSDENFEIVAKSRPVKRRKLSNPPPTEERPPKKKREKKRGKRKVRIRDIPRLEPIRRDAKRCKPNNLKSDSKNKGKSVTFAMLCFPSKICRSVRLLFMGLFKKKY